MRKYVIITSDEVSSVDFTKVEETSVDTLRYNREGTKTFVKFNSIKSYDEDTPDFLIGKTKYTYEEILAILNDIDGEWYVEDTTSD
jgi:hypothetical protein|tara:strand:- start:491 stop:748 length:258 start_codon:yes stop_codon:yes gene_type:complete